MGDLTDRFDKITESVIEAAKKRDALPCAPTLFASRPRSTDRPFNALWLIDAPWAHPAWRQYVLALYDLDTVGPGKPVLHLPGATHEFLLYALDPTSPVTDTSISIESPPKAMRMLQPANLGYQFIAKDDLDATQRIAILVERIEKRTLSPDTDVRHWWDKLFADGFSLVHIEKSLTSPLRFLSGAIIV